VAGQDIKPMIQQSLNRMADFSEALSQGHWRGFSGQPIKHIVHIGIGGSYLGPRLVLDALAPYQSGDFHCHFIANIDPTEFHQVIAHLKPDNTLFIIASKSFGTQETHHNALAARQWFIEQGGDINQLDKHFVAVTANQQRAQEFGIQPAHIFPLWDWVGGRFSLWSAVGLPVVLGLGMEHFKALLAGAELIDKHFQQSPLAANMPVILGLLDAWYINFFNSQSQGVLPYASQLQQLPAYLQQLEMESLGKSVSRRGEFINTSTGAVVWGGVGTNGQHAYHQLLHQGQRLIPVDFIIARQPAYQLADHQAMLWSHCLAQSQALMQGKTLVQAKAELMAKGLSQDEVNRLAPHQVVSGNKPSNTLLMEQLTPQSLGALIALYEHRVFVKSVLWQINAFDQWGVELGKALGNKIFDHLLDSSKTVDSNQCDGSTSGLINYFLQGKLNH
jgi:glucose-6-phosphate isomerase